MIVARQNKEVISARSAEVEGLGYRDDPRRYRELGARWGYLAKLHRDQQGVLPVREPRVQSPTTAAPLHRENEPAVTAMISTAQ
jgi:hypothetical protein